MALFKPRVTVDQFAGELPPIFSTWANKAANHVVRQCKQLVEGFEVESINSETWDKFTILWFYVAGKTLTYASDIKDSGRVARTYLQIVNTIAGETGTTEFLDNNRINIDKIFSDFPSSSGGYPDGLNQVIAEYMIQVCFTKPSELVARPEMVSGVIGLELGACFREFVYTLQRVKIR